MAQPATGTVTQPPVARVEFPYYGHEITAKTCARFISVLFACSEYPSASSSSTSANTPTPRLAQFVAYALHRTRLLELVKYAALFLTRHHVHR